jgi:hypothetical protein
VPARQSSTGNPLKMMGKLPEIPTPVWLRRGRVENGGVREGRALCGAWTLRSGDPSNTRETQGVAMYP